MRRQESQGRSWRVVRRAVRRRVEDVFVGFGVVSATLVMIFLARPLGVVALLGLVLAALYVWQ